MVIIAIIAAAIMGTASAAIEHGRRSHTQALITRIHTLVMERTASYETRRIPLHQDFEGSIRISFNGVAAGQARQDVRLLGIRELMKMEMPDRWTDITSNPQILQNVPALTQLYRRIYAGLRGPDIALHQGAECLYLVVMHSTGDGEARTLFSSKDIADTDGDGAYEFVDGWGNPISWLRWPAHFTQSSFMMRDAEADHDPLDVYRRDMQVALGPVSSDYKTPPGAQRNVPQILSLYIGNNRGLRDQVGAFRMVPLIYSTGPDGRSDIASGSDSFIQGLDPYDPSSSIGLISDTNGDGENNFRDNVNNQLIEY
ncbi:MAG: hypothetical protein IT424_13200 [Pirellulales bacterium]|nr:hypothetical protein [Pirellulales bacterium]